MRIQREHPQLIDSLDVHKKYGSSTEEDKKIGPYDHNLTGAGKQLMDSQDSA